MHVSYLRAHRRWALATGSALLIGGVAAGAAVAVDDDSPKPQDALAVEQALTPPDGEIHLPGWRQELSAESVQCFVGMDEGPPRLLVRTQASEFPLEELLTRERLVDECASGNDAARQGQGLDTEGASTCVSRSSGRTAVVILSGSCGELSRLTDDDLARLNRLRALETAMLAVPSALGCPTQDQATQWAEDRLAEFDVAASVSLMDEGDRACYRPVAYWDNTEVLVQALGLQPK
jgi:hypothetical protein